MKVAVDTNILVRAAVRDHKEQAVLAAKLLAQAEIIAVAMPVLCEFVWVLRRVYGHTPADVAQAIRALLAVPAVRVDRPAVEVGLALLEEGGDFADGVIAFEGAMLCGETFFSFDREAVKRLFAQGRDARLLEAKWLE